jgi:PAS domain S-box-containing protein
MPSSYLMFQRVLTTHIRDIMQNVVDLTLEQSKNHLSKAKSAAYLTKQLLSADVVKNDINGNASLERYLFNQLSIYPHLAGIYFATPKGNFFYVSRNPKKVKDGYRTKIIRYDQNGNRQVKLVWRDDNFGLIAREEDPTDTYDPRKRPWYTGVIEKGEMIWTAPYIFYTSQKPGVTIAAPSLDSDGNLKGIVGVDVEISELSTFISKLKVGKTGQAFMLNRNGDVIAYKGLENLIIHKKNSSSFRLPKVSEINNDIVFNAFNSVNWRYDDDGFLKLDKSIFSSFLLGKKKYSCIFSPFPDKRLPWIIGVYVPEDDYLAELKRNRTFNLIGTIIISILASFLGLILARRIIRPIINLQKEAKAIKNNDLTTSFKTSSSFNEIQETANTFASMKQAIVNYEDTLVEKEEIYRAITNTANDAIIMMDENHLISYWNPAAEQMFGYGSLEVIGKNLHQAIAPSRFFARYNKGLQRFDNEERGQFIGKTIEVSAINNDGVEFPVEISLSTMKINGKRHALAIIRDITARTQNDQIKKRLAHDLHDGIGGNLTNIKLLSNILESKTDHNLINDGLHTIADLSTDCISEIRNYMNVLEDRDLNWKDFIDELRQYTIRVVEPYDITPSVTSEVSENAAPPNTFTYMNLFKIVKEAVNNSIKHAHAANIWVKFEITDETFICTIKDNGNGISPKAGSGRGLLSMEGRATELGGTFTLTEKDGVTVTITVPIISANKSV